MESTRSITKISMQTVNTKGLAGVQVEAHNFYYLLLLKNDFNNQKTEDVLHP